MHWNFHNKKSFKVISIRTERKDETIWEHKDKNGLNGETNQITDMVEDKEKIDKRNKGVKGPLEI